MRKTQLSSAAVRLAPALILMASTGLLGCGQPNTYRDSKKGSGLNGKYGYVNDYGGQLPATAADGPGGASPGKVVIMGTGYDAHTYSVKTRTVLKVRFIPGKQNQQAADGKFYHYSKLGVFIKAGSVTIPTEAVYNGLGGGSAMQSSVIDLSDSFNHTCEASDKSCSTEVQITVTQPNNDDDCINQGFNCPTNKVPSGHGWNGTLLIQTDDTAAI